MINRIVLNPQAFFGKGAVKIINKIIYQNGFNHGFIVTDNELMKFGITNKVSELLNREGLAFTVFSEVKQNPTIQNVIAGVDAFKECGADYIIAVGGGSVIDCAKAIGIIINNPEFSDVVKLEGQAHTRNKSVTTIAVPTTAGTAAEVTINYVLTDEENKRKFVCVDTHDIPEYSIIDYEMMMSMPSSLTAATGMDALTHAIEGYITKNAWEMSDMFHLKAIELIALNLRKAVIEKDEEAFEKMSYAQYIAGMGFSNVGLGIVHSMAHPLGAVYNTPHGVANAILLPFVMEYNSNSSGDKYKEIANALGVKNVDYMDKNEFRKAAVDAVLKLSSDIGIPKNLYEIGVNKKDFEFLSISAFNDVCTGGNPRETSIADILALYEKAYSGGNI